MIAKTIMSEMPVVSPIMIGSRTNTAEVLTMFYRKNLVVNN